MSAARRADRGWRAPRRSGSRGRPRAPRRSPDACWRGWPRRRARHWSRRRRRSRRWPPARPAGICTIESSESRPLRAFDCTGTPRTGRLVLAAVMPGRCAAPPAPAMMTSRPRARALGGVFEQQVRSAVGGDHPHLVRNVPSFSSVSAALRRVSQSEAEPMMMPTSTFICGILAEQGAQRPKQLPRRRGPDRSGPPGPRRCARAGAAPTRRAPLCSDRGRAAARASSRERGLALGEQAARASFRRA